MNPRMLLMARILASLVFAILVLNSPQTARAQEARGTIKGTVVDGSGAIVPNASVKITNVAMGVSVTVPTNTAGVYQAPFLIPGTYRMEVTNQGFKKYVRDNIVLRINDLLELAVELEIGTVDQSVTVTGDTAVLDTASASLGQVVDARRIAELPIGHGDAYALIGLAGGVSFSRSLRLDRPFEPTHIVGYAMDGTRANRSDVTVDGASSTATANAGEVISSYVPQQDLVQEFKVQTATFDASFGNTEGGVTNLSIKSGTNNFHGTIYYSNFTKGTSANDFYANRTNTPLADFYYHRYGGTVGGPIAIPKVYNGKNKTFFMYGFEGIRESRPRNNGVFQIPTNKMRTGDFSELLAIGPQFQLYNPFTRRADTGGRFRQDPFVGNIIPTSMINPVAKKFIDTYLPGPTSTPTAADGTNNFVQADLQEPVKYATNTIRIDHVFNQNHRTFGRASWYDRNSDYNNYYRNIATGTHFQFVSRQAVVDHVWTVTPTMILNFRGSYNRFIRSDDTNPDNWGFDLTSLGFPSSYANLIPEDLQRFPRFEISGYQGTGAGADFRPCDTWNFITQATKVAGEHAVKFGVEFRSYRENAVFHANNQTGQFNFDNTYTKGPLDNATQANQLGFSFAAFLLGVASSGAINSTASYAEQSLTWGFFVHDDWRVNNRLTLNLGLRYELEGALTERFDRSVTGFDFPASQSFEAQARANYAKNPLVELPADQFNVKGGLQFASVNGQDRALYNVPLQNFMPRLGLAYKITDKTVLRMGYGIYFGFLGQRRGDVIQTGFSQTTPLNVTNNSGLSFIETLSNPFQSGVRVPVGADQGIATFLGQNVTFFNQNPLSPYMQRWQIGLQREIGRGFVGEISYVGNRGTHVERNVNLNATPNKYLSTSPVRDDAKNAYLTGNVTNPFFGIPGLPVGTFLTNATITRERLLRPFPQFDQVNSTTNDGYSWYHSVQMNLEKRFAAGYTFEATYTFSKFMEAVEVLNAGDPRPTETLAGEDRPHRFSSSGIYELPFGKNRKYLSQEHGFTSALVSGWQISGIYAYQSGPPIGFGNIIFTGNVADIALPADQQALLRWFNTEAGFNKVTTQQLVSNIRTFPLRFGHVRAQAISNIDFGIVKKTYVGEGKEFQFRAEFLNFFNHPLLFTSQINTSPTQAAFGQVTAGTQENYPRRFQMTFKFLF